MVESTEGTPRRLYKSRRDRIIDGVCGGVAEYFGVDATIVRFLWVLITLLGGSGFILYILGMIIMPVNPEHVSGQAGTAPHPTGDRKRFFGVMLILLGTFILMIKLGWIAEFGWWSFSKSVMLPVLLILMGGFFIYLQTGRKRVATAAGEHAGSEPSAAPAKDLRRSVDDRKLFGVCGGIAKYFSIDSTIVRFLFVFLVLASFGWGVLLYIILGIIMPEERPSIRSV